MNKTKTAFLFGLFAIVCLIAPSHILAQESSWPQFLGPNRNGTSEATELINEIPSTGLNEKWRVPGGVGMAAIVVDGEDAVTMARQENQQTVVCLNAETGETKWTAAMAPAYNNAMGNGTRATPTLTKDRVFAFSGEGILAALDRETGKSLWQVNTVKELHGEVAEYGMASSPLVNGDTVYVIVGAPNALVAAYNTTDGKLKWKSGNGLAGYSSPTLLEVAGKSTLLAFSGDRLHAMDPADGSQLWSYPFPTNYNCNIVAPIKIEDDLFLSAGEDHGCVRLKVTPKGDQFEVKEVWSALGKKSPFRNEWQTPIYINGYLYGMDNVGGAGPITHLACIDASNGEMIWRESRYGKGNFTYADGKLFISTIEGQLILAKVDPKGYHPLGKQDLVGMTRQSPSIANGCLYLRDDKEIVCVEVSQ